MYTKQEISKQTQAFWTAFGRYMKPVLSTDGEEISWLNYKTGNKHIHFKMDVDSRQAYIAIVVQHPDLEMQRAYFDRLVQLKNIFEETVEEDWTWEPERLNEQGGTVSSIQKQLAGVSLFKNEDWPAIISFLKPRVIALDGFWTVVQDQFTKF